MSKSRNTNNASRPSRPPVAPRDPVRSRTRRLLLGAVIAVVISLGVTGTILAASGAGGHPTLTLKEQRLAQYATQQALAHNHIAATKGPEVPTAASCPDPTFSQPGISYNFNPDFSIEHTINVANVEPLKNAPAYKYIVYAGYQATNAQQGMIIVMRMDVDPCLKTSKGSVFHTYLTPYQRGGVTLTALNGEVVTFTTSGGASGSFNFVMGQFL